MEPQAAQELRFVKATGKSSTLHLADGEKGVCDPLWTMRPATDDELKALDGKHCKICLKRLEKRNAPKPEPRAKQAKGDVKVSRQAPRPKKADTLHDEAKHSKAEQERLRAERQEREAVTA